MSTYHVNVVLIVVGEIRNEDIVSVDVDALVADHKLLVRLILFIKAPLDIDVGIRYVKLGLPHRQEDMSLRIGLIELNQVESEHVLLLVCQNEELLILNIVCYLLD